MVDSKVFAARHLRLLSMALMKGSQDISDELGLGLKMQWASTLLFMERNPDTTAAVVARTLAISHVQIQKNLKEMEAAGLVSSASDPKDHRQVRFSLTEQGRASLNGLRQITVATTKAYEDLFAETGIDLGQVAQRVSSAIDQTDWASRLRKHING